MGKVGHLMGTRIGSAKRRKKGKTGEKKQSTWQEKLHNSNLTPADVQEIFDINKELFES